jgi:hypothetical protein
VSGNACGGGGSYRHLVGEVRGAVKGAFGAQGLHAEKDPAQKAAVSRSRVQ